MDPLSKKQIDEIKKAVNKLSSKKVEEREAAQKTLDALGASKFDILLNLLQQEAAGRRSRRRFVTVGLSVYLALVVAMLVVPLMFGERPEWKFLGQFGSMTGA